MNVCFFVSPCMLEFSRCLASSHYWLILAMPPCSLHTARRQMKKQSNMRLIITRKLDMYLHTQKEINNSKISYID